MALSENTPSQKDNLNKVTTMLNIGGNIFNITSLYKQIIKLTKLLETSKLFIRYNENWKKNPL